MVGIVKGSTIQTVNAIRDIGAGLKTLIGSLKLKQPEKNEKPYKSKSLQSFFSSSAGFFVYDGANWLYHNVMIWLFTIATLGLY